MSGLTDGTGNASGDDAEASNQGSEQIQGPGMLYDAVATNGNGSKSGNILRHYGIKNPRVLKTLDDVQAAEEGVVLQDGSRDGDADRPAVWHVMCGPDGDPADVPLALCILAVSDAGLPVPASPQLERPSFRLLHAIAWRLCERHAIFAEAFGETLTRGDGTGEWAGGRTGFIRRLAASMSVVMGGACAVRLRPRMVLAGREVESTQAFM